MGGSADVRCTPCTAGPHLHQAAKGAQDPHEGRARRGLRNAVVHAQLREATAAAAMTQGERRRCGSLLATDGRAFWEAAPSPGPVQFRTPQHLAAHPRARPPSPSSPSIRQGPTDTLPPPHAAPSPSQRRLPSRPPSPRTWALPPPPHVPHRGTAAARPSAAPAPRPPGARCRLEGTTRWEVPSNTA
jgi:hypothetical protein